MKIKKTILALALSAVAITGAKAFPSYNDGDVFMGIRNKTGSLTYVMDLGSLDQFINAANGGSPISFNTVLGFTGAQLASDLTAQVGANWYNNANVTIGLFGGFQAGSSSSSISNMPDNALIIGSPVRTAIGNLNDQTSSTLTGYAAGIGANINGANSLNVGVAWVSQNAGAGAWDTYQYGGTPNSANAQGSSAYGIYPGTLETQIGNTLYVNSVFDSGAGQNNGYTGANIGTLSVSSGGAVEFTAAPEPSTYALAAFGALLLVIAYRRKSNA